MADVEFGSDQNRSEITAEQRVVGFALSGRQVLSEDGRSLLQVKLAVALLRSVVVLPTFTLPLRRARFCTGLIDLQYYAMAEAGKQYGAARWPQDVVQTRQGVGTRGGYLIPMATG